MFIDGFNLHDGGSAINRPVIIVGSATHRRFSSKPLSTLGFFLDAVLLRAQIRSALTLFSMLFQYWWLQLCFISWQALLPTSCPLMAQLARHLKCPAREHRIHVGLRASCLLFLWSQKKLPGKDFDDQERYPNRGRQIPSFAICQSAGRGPLCGFSLHSLWPRQRHPRQGASF